MKKTNKLLVVMTLVVLLLSSLMVASQAAESQYITMSNVSANVGEKVTVEVKAKSDLNIDDINLTVSFDSTKLSTSADDVKVPETLKADVGGSQYFTAMSGFRNGNAVLGAYDDTAFTVRAGTTLLTIDFTVLASGDSTVSAKYDAALGTDVKIETAEATVTGIKAVESVTLDKTSATLEVKGDLKGTTTLLATVGPDDATSKEVTWSSNNTSVATVENGVVTAQYPGTATITAKAGDKTATCTITVVAPITGIELSQTTLEIYKNQSATLTAEILPNYTTDTATVTWSSSDESVATVKNGVVTGLKDGTATIVAKVGDYTKTCNVTVTEVALESVALDTKDFELEEGSTKQLEILKNPENATDDLVIEWSSSDEEVATVVNGLVTGVKPGKATITAVVNGEELSVEVTITEKVVDSLPIDPVGGVDGEGDSSVLPETGDIAIGLAVVLLLVSAAGIFFIVKRNRK